MKGLIALDIDGTITKEIDRIPEAVVRCLEGHVLQGWKVCFITGRGLSRSLSALSSLPFPIHLAIHNGAMILEMPSRKLLKKTYLDTGIFGVMDKICAGNPSDFVVFGGMENRDACYYRPHLFDQELLKYVEKRFKLCHETWHPVETYDNLPISTFPAIKCFGDRQRLKEITDRVQEELCLHIPIINDEMRLGMSIAQGVHGTVSKGSAVVVVKQLLNVKGPVIGAGDDLNDIPLLGAADIKIAMSTGPAELIEMADIIAAPAKEFGIIAALESAVYGK